LKAFRRKLGDPLGVDLRDGVFSNELSDQRCFFGTGSGFKEPRQYRMVALLSDANLRGAAARCSPFRFGIGWNRKLPSKIIIDENALANRK
jgi:hypothetical protein